MRLLHVLGSILLALFFFCSDSLAQTSCNDVSFDGHTYNAIKLGNQCWFSQNLRTTVYADGTSVPEVTDASEWESSEDAQCAYNNDTSNVSVYGRLYNWYAATNPAGLCPTGWRVPSATDWNTLMTHLDAEGFDGVEGTALKSTTTWNGGGGTNELGFSGVAGGVRTSGGGFINQGSVSRHKSTTSAGNEVSYSYKLVWSSTELVIGSSCSYHGGTAVRCMQEAVSGCTDDGACNYNSAANTDNGNCTYQTTWYADADGDDDAAAKGR